MKFLRKILYALFVFGVILYLGVCAFLYFKQENFIFHPKALPADYKFAFKGAQFEERNIIANDGAKLSGLLFKADSSKGLIFYLHGNAGALDTWGPVAESYNQLGYDVFIIDYRGFGKSEGTISSEKQFYNDIRAAYTDLQRDYAENTIVILGYSIGTGPAAMLASETNSKMLILLAPYFSLTDMMRNRFPLIPTFLLQYKFATNEFLKKTKVPVFIFHGDTDDVINYEASLKLKEYLKPNGKLTILRNQGHGKMNDNPEYLQRLSEIL